MVERLNDLLANDYNIGLQRFRVTHRVYGRHLDGAQKLGMVLLQNDGDLAHALQYKLHHNSEVASMHLFGDERPLSAYFIVTKDPRNRSVLSIVWGKVNEKGHSKVHTFLSENPVYKGLKEDCVFQRSGHIATVTIPYSQESFVVALLDSISKIGDKSTVTKKNVEFLIVTTLLSNYIIPITTDGYVITVDTVN